MMVEVPKHVRKRSEYTYKEKQTIIQNYYKSDFSVTNYSKLINVNRRTLQDWINDKNKILNIEGKKLKAKKIGCGKKKILPLRIELDILNWFKNIRIDAIPVSDELIKARGFFLLKKSRKKIKFNFSNGWLQKFKIKYHIRKRKGGSKFVRIKNNEILVIDTFIEDIKKKIQTNNYDSVINVDETGVYYDSHVNFTLDIKNTKRVEIITTGREKQRVTVVLGIDLLNKINIKPFIIIKGKTERCLKDIKINANCNLSYQNKSWCNEKQFIKFLSTFPNNKKILLLLDNCTSHKTQTVKLFLKNEYPLIEIQYLPPNTTSILQPLDVGLNGPFKASLRNKYISWLITNFDNGKDISQVKKKERTNFLVKWISTSWKKVNTITNIKNSFKFCGYIEDNNNIPKCKSYIINKENKK